MRRRPLFAAALAWMATAAPALAQPLPPCPAAPCTFDAGRQIVILSYLRDRDLTNLINAELASGIPDDTPVFYGIYWGTLPNPIKLPPPPPPPPGPRPVLPSARFAPLFSLARTEFFAGREIEAGDDGYGGPVPSWRRLTQMGPKTRYAWGLELGRRYRDRIHLKRTQGMSVTTWQFDELRNEVAGRGGYRLRQFTAGVLRGLAYGRAARGDTKLPGIVYATVPALRLAAGGRGASVAHFWQIVDDTALYFVGEEYPEFTGPPRRAARRYGTFREAMRHRDAARRSLAAKYVVGLTPGARLVPGLGGNVRHRNRGVVRRWRQAYVRTRAASRPIGIAEYNFTFENATVPVMRDALAAVAAGLRVASRR